MRFRYSTTGADQDEFDSLPRVPIILRSNNRAVEAVGLVDSGAMVNVLPYEIGLQLGATWDDRRANIRLAGVLGNRVAMPVFAAAEIESLPSVRLAFAWVKSDDTPIILGQTNFFIEFDVFFYRSQLEFEVRPRRTDPSR